MTFDIESEMFMWMQFDDCYSVINFETQHRLNNGNDRIDKRIVGQSNYVI